MRDNLSSPAVKDVLGFITFNYRERFYYFELISMLRKAAIMSTFAIFTGADQSMSMRQAVISALILTTSLVVYQRCSPHTQLWLNRLEANGQLVELLVVFTGLITLSKKTSHGFGNGLGTFTVFLTLVQYMCIMAALLYELRRRSGFLESHQEGSHAHIMREMRRQAARTEHKRRQHERMAKTLIRKARQGTLTGTAAESVVARVLREFGTGDISRRSVSDRRIISFFPKVEEKVQGLLEALEDGNATKAELEAENVCEALARMTRASTSHLWAIHRAHVFAQILLSRRAPYLLLNTAATRHARAMASHVDILEHIDAVRAAYRTFAQKASETDDAIMRRCARRTVDALLYLLRDLDKFLVSLSVRSEAEGEAGVQRTHDSLCAHRDALNQLLYGDTRSDAAADVNGSSVSSLHARLEAASGPDLSAMLKNLPTALEHMRGQIMAELGDDAPSERADDPLSRAEAWRLLHEAHESNRKREGLQLRRGGARPVHHALSPTTRVRTMEALARDLASAADDHTADLVRAIDTACNRALNSREHVALIVASHRGGGTWRARAGVRTRGHHGGLGLGETRGGDGAP